MDSELAMHKERKNPCKNRGFFSLRPELVVVGRQSGRPIKSVLIYLNMEEKLKQERIDRVAKYMGWTEYQKVRAKDDMNLLVPAWNKAVKDFYAISPGNYNDPLLPDYIAMATRIIESPLPYFTFYNRVIYIVEILDFLEKHNEKRSTTIS